MKAGRILAWDRAKGQQCDPPAYALTDDRGRSTVIVGNDLLDVGTVLPGFVYDNPTTRETAQNRYVPEVDWPDEVIRAMAQLALLGRIPDGSAS